MWVRLGQFHYSTELGAERAKLVQLIQKFVQRSCVVIFRNEGTLSTPLDPKLMFWCVSFRLGAFGLFHYCTKPAAKHAKLVQLMQKFRP